MKLNITKRAIVPVFFLLVVTGLGIKAMMPISAPDFTATTLDNRRITFGQLLGKPWYLAFWSVSCSTCLADFDQLINLHRQLSKQGGQVIAIAVAQDKDNTITSVAQPLMDAGITVIHDKDGSLADAFSHNGITPYGFLINPQGHITHIHAGKLQINIILDALQQGF